MIIVVAPGPRALLQDLGRPGQAALGVSRSGAADRAASRLANRLIGNPVEAAVIETVLGGLIVEAAAPHWVAITGAARRVIIDGLEQSSHAPIRLPRGARLELPAPETGLCSYLAVRGGFAVEPVLGSRSHDTLAGLGPAPLKADQRLPVGAPAGPWPGVDLASPRPRSGTLRIDPGPRRDWFTAAAWELLITTEWRVGTAVDRVGVRLDGPALPRSRTDELPSEGLIRGAIQVPADGHPLIFGPDHPVTGGYPVIAVVRGADLDATAQLRPGDPLRLVRTEKPPGTTQF
ncbi:biotin-dependent carboxyltransferase family protein [Microlunatus speluncae]|uniref:5-oxoprolinase subunit C family protein n=1 Tax=Microlunatus speluncae TaxID=2594267 RepID=UPI001266497C|nr:biotin-dependent carboxyltransferase family protein [Microlunatus speluncae]